MKDEVTQKHALYSLENEISRYSYFQPEYGTEYINVMAAYVNQEVNYIICESYGHECKTRTRGEIITYNLISYTMDVKRYISIKIQ